jgi:glucosamine-phosphate N-acetyltransferase
MDTKFFLRRVNKTDYKHGHLELYQQLTKITPEVMSFEEYEKFIDALSDNHMIFIVWHVETKKVIATGTILIENKLIHNFGKVGHIEDIVVNKDYRSCGIGKILIDCLVNYAKLKNCYKVILNTSKETENFYKKCNFTNNGIEMAMYF